MAKRKIIYSDTSKIITLDNKSNNIIYEFTNECLTDTKKVYTDKNLKYRLANISNFFFNYVNNYNVPTGYLGIIKRNVVSFDEHERLPISVKIVNRLNKKIAKIFQLMEGYNLSVPIYEYYYGDDKSNYVNDSHLVSLNICSNQDLKLIERLCSKLNAVMKFFFERRNAQLAEMQCYFGKKDDKIFIVDDFTPLSIRVFPLNITNTKFNPLRLNSDKDMNGYLEYFQTLISK